MPATIRAQRFGETEWFLLSGREFFMEPVQRGNLFHPGYLEVLIIGDDLCIH